MKQEIAELVNQKHSSRGVLEKRCSENMQQIYRRTPMPKSDFNNVAKQLHWNHIFSTLFFPEHLRRAASECLKDLDGGHILIIIYSRNQNSPGTTSFHFNFLKKMFNIKILLYLFDKKWCQIWLSFVKLCLIWFKVRFFSKVLAISWEIQILNFIKIV